LKIFAAGPGFESRLLSSLWTLQPDPQLHYTLPGRSEPFSFLVSLFVSLVLCDTAAGGAEAAALARLHHVARSSLWAVSGRLRSCAAAVEAALAQLPALAQLNQYNNQLSGQGAFRSQMEEHNPKCLLLFVSEDYREDDDEFRSDHEDYTGN
jgi:hypothetical protein